MTRRLVLVRHAEAAAATEPDRDRPLVVAGMEAARALGRWLTDRGIRPDRVVISPSLRTRQTWEIAAPAEMPAAEFDERIYDNTVDDLLAVVRETPPAVQTLLLVGHNPSTGGLAAAFDPSVRRFPMGGAAIFSLDEWADAPTGQLIAFRE